MEGSGITAIQASTSSSDKASEERPTSAEIVAFMEKGVAKGEKLRRVDARNDLRVTEFDGKVRCETRYRGLLVHRQWFLY